MIKYLSIVFFSFLLISASVTAKPVQLTESAIHDFLRQVDVAAKRKSLGKINSLIDDSFTFYLTSTVNGIAQEPLNGDKKLYTSYIQQGFMYIDNYQSKRSNLKINIKDNRAYCVDTLQENIVQNGQSIYSITQEKFIIDLKQNRLVYTYYEGQTTIE